MKNALILAAALAVATLAGCAGPAATRTGGASEAKAATGAKAVEARAKKRWDLLVAHKTSEAWDYLSPGYREIKPRETYVSDLAQRPVKWTRAEVLGSTCPEEGQVCDIEIEVYFTMESTLPGVGTLESHSPVIERWIETDGNWYFVPKEVARN